MELFDLEIENANIITSTQEFYGSVSIKNGEIAAITQKPLKKSNKTINADGLTLMPGMIDQHVHFMDPGETEREDFITGSKAAAMGGVTSVVEHTHSHPVRNVNFLKEKIQYLQGRSY